MFSAKNTPLANTARPGTIFPGIQCPDKHMANNEQKHVIDT